MRPVVVAIAMSISLAGGCVLFTGSTDGYSQLDSGSSGCTSAASCGDSGLCCLIVTSSTTSIAGTCQPSCSVAIAQLCAANAECGDAGPCSTQTCMVDAGGGISFSLKTCGNIPGCTASP